MAGPVRVWIVALRVVYADRSSGRRTGSSGQPGRLLRSIRSGTADFLGSLELGIQTAISNWFIRRRPLGLAADAIAMGAGLTMVPLLAQFIITGSDWRIAWFTLGILAFVLGVVPPVLFMARRPEDMGLQPDPVPQDQLGAEPTTSGNASESKTAAIEPNFTVGQAFRTRAFWLLAAFSMAGYMVQAGVGLHQVAHYIDQGLPGPSAALTASAFAFSQILSGMFFGGGGEESPRKVPAVGGSLRHGGGGLRQLDEHIPALSADFGCHYWIRGGRPASIGEACLGRLLRARTSGDDTGFRHVSPARGSGCGTDGGRVFVRCHRLLSIAHHGVHRLGGVGRAVGFVRHPTQTPGSASAACFGLTPRTQKVQLASSSFRPSSMNLVSSGLRPGPPPMWPQKVGITRSSALGIWETLMWPCSTPKSFWCP